MKEPDEARAEQLHEELTKRGVVNFVHWDRSPWGVRIPLTDDENDISLYVLTEGVLVAGDESRWEWDGSIGGIESDDPVNQLIETQLRWLEWSNGPADVAKQLVSFVRVLRYGIEKLRSESQLSDEDIHRIITAYDAIVRLNTTSSYNAVQAVHLDEHGEVFGEVLDTAESLGLIVLESDHDLLVEAVVRYRATL